MSRSRIRYLAVALAAVSALFIITGLVTLKSLPRIARRMVTADLQDRFRSTIEIGQLEVEGLIPPRIVASDIIVRYQGRNDVPPLMTVRRLTASAGLSGAWTKQWRVHSLRLEGLQIRIPPQTDDRGPNLPPQFRPKLRWPPIEFDEVAADDNPSFFRESPHARKPRRAEPPWPG